MKPWMSNLLGFTLGVLFANFVHAGVNQWTTNGPAGRSANALVVDPKNPATLYVGTEEGVFKSTDSAESWLKLSLPFAVEVNALTIDPSNPATLYASYRRIIPLPDGYRTEPGVLKSSDGGVGWTEVFTPPGGDGCDTVLAIVPTTPASVYLRCNNSQLFKSVDDDRIWVLLGLPQNGIILKIVVDPTTPTTIYTVTSSGTFKSTDSGGTWIDFEGPRFDTPTEILDLAIAPSVPHTMYANVYATTDGYLFDPVGTYQSIDGGKSWTAHPRFLSFDIVFDPFHPDSLYLGGLQTTDGGRNWVVIKEGFPDSVGVQVFAIDPRSGPTLYAGVVSLLPDNAPVQGLVYKRQIVGASAVGVIGTVESPEDGQPVSGIGFLREWSFAAEPPLRWQRYRLPSVRPTDLVVDGKVYDRITCCADREDVAAAFPDKAHAIISGWAMQFNYGEFEPGEHILSVEINPGSPTSQTLTRRITTIRIGGFRFLDQFNLTGATARIDGEEIVLSGVQIHDKASQQTKVIEVRLRWFQHSQALGIVASS